MELELLQKEEVDVHFAELQAFELIAGPAGKAKGVAEIDVVQRIALGDQVVRDEPSVLGRMTIAYCQIGLVDQIADSLESPAGRRNGRSVAHVELLEDLRIQLFRQSRRRVDR